MKTFLKKPFMLFLVLAVGFLAAFLLVKNKPDSQRVDTAMPAKAVKVIAIKEFPFAAQVTAYGHVEPSVLLEAKAEVSGKVNYLHPQLKQGESIAANTVVVGIDPEDYQVSLQQTEEDLIASQSSLAQLKEEERSTKRALRLAKKNLAVGEAEYRRVKEIWDKRLVSRSTLDVEQQKVIQLRQQVEELQGQLNSYSSRYASTRAQIARAKQQVKGQKNTLGRTEIKLDFDALIGSVAIGKGEFVSVGTLLFEALGTDGVEIEAQVPIHHMRALVSALGDKEVSISAENAQQILKAMQLAVKVQLVGEKQAVWDADVVRFSEAIDPVRRTLGIVVAIDKPHEKIIPGRRPPLLKGMYTAVHLYAPQRQAIVIPRKAIHQGRVYLVDDDNRLMIRPISVQWQQGEIAVIERGLVDGDRLIINDFLPVIEGMLLQPLPAEAVEQQLQRQSRGVTRVSQP